MKIGFIGAGRMATTIGRHLIGAGHEVILSSSRGPEALAGPVADLGPAASAGSKTEAAECDVVILATNWADAPEALTDLQPSQIAARSRCLTSSPKDSARNVLSLLDEAAASWPGFPMVRKGFRPGCDVQTSL
jgi:3-hydroxyisobutyrate dehydrogenase-like beta-hydroxyacid dehydrogenase